MFILVDNKSGVTMCVCEQHETAVEFGRAHGDASVQEVKYFDGYTKPSQVTLYEATSRKEYDWVVNGHHRIVWNFEITPGSTITADHIHVWGFYMDAVLSEMNQRLAAKSRESIT